MLGLIAAFIYCTKQRLLKYNSDEGDKTFNKVIEFCGMILYDPTKDPQDYDGTLKSSLELDICMANRVC